MTAKSDQDADQGIRMDQHWFGSLDPDPHCHPWDKKSWVRIRIRIETNGENFRVNENKF